MDTNQNQDTNQNKKIKCISVCNCKFINNIKQLI